MRVTKLFPFNNNAPISLNGLEIEVPSPIIVASLSSWGISLLGEVQSPVLELSVFGYSVQETTYVWRIVTDPVELEKLMEVTPLPLHSMVIPGCRALNIETTTAVMVRTHVKRNDSEPE